MTPEYIKQWLPIWILSFCCGMLIKISDQLSDIISHLK